MLRKSLILSQIGRRPITSSEFAVQHTKFDVMYLNIRIVASFGMSSAHLQLQNAPRQARSGAAYHQPRKAYPAYGAGTHEGAGHQFETQMIAAAQARSLHRPAPLLASQNLAP
jgi:hypothetical protein